MEIQIVLMLLASFSLCCSAAIESRRQPMPGSKERVMLALLHQHYDTDAEPPLSGDANTTVMTWLNLLCSTPVGDFVSIEGWIAMMWKDARLQWDPSDFDGVDALRISANRIWKPDLFLYNAMKTDMADVMAVVYNSGQVLWIPPVNYLIRCHHPDNDITNCTLKFGSWTYSADIVDFEQQAGEALVLSDYLVSCPSVVQSHESTRNVMYYSCCSEPYVDITINLQLAWR